MITKKEYENAFVEVLEILKYLPQKDFLKIPSNLIQMMKIEKSKDYYFKINRTKSLREQNFSPVTKAIISNFYRDYWATKYEKEIIKAKQKLDLDLKEREKLKKYQKNKTQNKW